MYSIIVSKKCPVGQTLKPVLLNEFGFKEIDKEFDGNKICISETFPKFQLITIEKHHLYADYLSKLETELFIIASTHTSKEGVPAFTVHPVGNYDKAELGGKEKTLVFSSAVVIKKIFLEMNQETL